MKVLGIDLSSQPAGTAAAVIDWSEASATAKLHNGCNDNALHALIADSQVIGIDAPFGWPETFRAAVQSWPYRNWNDSLRDELTLRETDRHVMCLQGGRPLSVAADRIAIPAMRAMSLLAVHGVTDRSGDGRFYEVYPKASLQAWDISPKSYKSAKKPDALPARLQILQRLRDHLPWLNAGDAFAESADGLDALIAALTALAGAQHKSHLPAPAQSAAAKTEGWIHVPTAWPTPINE